MNCESKIRASIVLLTAAMAMNLMCRVGFAAPATTQAVPAAPEIVKTQLELSLEIVDPREKAVHAIRGTSMYITPFNLLKEKPVVISKEPKYVGEPLYGAFRIGNGPKSVTYFSVDEAKDFAGKIYIDLNQNGDLTDDGPADWDESHTPTYGRYCIKTVSIHASWGTALEEKDFGNYSIIITKPDGVSKGAYVKRTARTGMLRLGDKAYPVVLAENTGDGMFTVPADADMTRAPVNLYIDTENKTPFEQWGSGPGGGPPREPQKFNLGHPFQIDGHWYMARPSISGGTLTSQETTAPGESEKAPSIASDKLPVGIDAPDITVQTPDGKPVKISDFKGKLVVLDFWATWCAPCQASMPLLEKVYQDVKDQGVVVLSVNVLDEKELFDEWMKTHANNDYHFNFAFDPAGKDERTSIAKTTYDTIAIPAWFLISRDGKIAAKDNGFDGTQNKLIKALREQKIIVKTE